jgi:hypothetical protein
MKKRRIAIVTVVIAVALFLYLAPVYYHNPQFCAEYCSPESVSPIAQWTVPLSRDQNGGPYGVFGAAYVVRGLPCGGLMPTCAPKPEYTIWFGTRHWNFFF